MNLNEERKNKILKYTLYICGGLMIITTLLATYFKVIWQDENLYEIFKNIGLITETPMMIIACVLLYRIWRLKQCQR